MARTKATMAKVLVLSPAPCTAGAAHHSPPAVEDFGSAFCLSLSLSLSFLRFFSFLSLSPSRLLRLPPPSLKLTAHSHSQPLDLGEPVYGSRVLCEPLCVAVWVIFRVNPWVVDVWPWAL
uniref:Uncharacterized protein n=1 Tax=Fagus sylvatica TaxID=28930 RepID=A0A2N9IF66_FAGSY